jgi:hypothetical protein
LPRRGASPATPCTTCRRRTLYAGAVHAFRKRDTKYYCSMDIPRTPASSSATATNAFQHFPVNARSLEAAPSDEALLVCRPNLREKKGAVSRPAAKRRRVPGAAPAGRRKPRRPDRRTALSINSQSDADAAIAAGVGSPHPPAAIPISDGDRQRQTENRAAAVQPHVGVSSSGHQPFFCRPPTLQPFSVENSIIRARFVGIARTGSLMRSVVYLDLLGLLRCVACACYSDQHTHTWLLVLVDNRLFRI